MWRWLTMAAHGAIPGVLAMRQRGFAKAHDLGNQLRLDGDEYRAVDNWHPDFVGCLNSRRSSGSMLSRLPTHLAIVRIIDSLGPDPHPGHIQGVFRNLRIVDPFRFAIAKIGIGVRTPTPCTPGYPRLRGRACPERVFGEV